MYNTSAAFKTAMAQPSRELTARGTITFPDATTHALTPTEISKFTITENAGDHLPLGGVSASTLTLILDNRLGEWEPGGSILGTKSLDGAIVELEIGVNNSGYEYANAGVFVIEKPVSQEQDAIITLKGSDYLANRALRAFSDTLTYPQTVLQIVTEACLQANITLKTTMFVNSTVSIPVKPVWDENTTCRDVISYVACLAGGFARIDRNGDLEIISFANQAEGLYSQLLDSSFEIVDGDLVWTHPAGYTGPAVTLVGSDLFIDEENIARLNDGEFQFIGTFDGTNYYVHPNRYKKLTNQGVMFGPFNALSVYEYGAPNGYGATRIADDIDIVDNELNSAAVRGNPLLAYGSTALTTLMTNMLTSLSGLEYYAASIEWQGDPSITCGDMVTISNLKGEAYNVLITNQTLTFGPGFSMVTGNRLNTAVVGKAKVENLRVFTPTGKLNAAALDGDINIRAGRQLNLLSDGALVVKSGADLNIESGGKLTLESGNDVDIGADTLADLLAAATSQTTIWYQDNQPTATATGDIWYDTDASPVTIKRWDGSAWVDITTTALSQALTAAGTAQATADGKIKAWAQTTAPYATAVGDLWIDTDDNNKLYRATAAGTGNWVLYKVAAGYVSTSHITIDNDNIDIVSGGTLTLDAADDLKIGSGGDTLVTFTDTAIDAKANTIDLSANNSIKLAVSGGTNILRNSGRFNDLLYWSVWSGDNSATLNRRDPDRWGDLPLYVSLGSEAANLYNHSISNYPFAVGEQYTLSFWARYSFTYTISIRDSDGTNAVANFGSMSPKETYADGWNYYEATAEVTSAPNAPVLYIGLGASQWRWMTRFKLEEGTMATDWSPSPSDPASGVKTSYIDIATDHIDISSGGNVNITAGSDFNVRAGKQNKSLGISNNEANGYMLWAGASIPAQAPFSVTMDGSLKAINLDGAFILGVENGGTGETVNRTHRGSTVPSNSFGQDGDLYVLFNGAVGTTWNDTNLTFGSNTQSTYFGVNRNWNYQQATNYRRIGNGTGSASYDFGTYGSFVCPAATKTLNFKFTTTKYVGGQSLSSGVTSYRVALVSSLTGTILATTTVDASTSAILREVTLTTASNLTQGSTYYLGIYYPDQTELNGAAVYGNIVLKGSTSSTVGSALYVKTNGAWVRLAYA